MKTKTTKQIRRDKPCNCGCKGTDPWHRRTFDRVVRNVETIGGVDLRGGHTRLVDVLRGVVKMPWGEQVVYGEICVHHDGRQRVRGWHF